MPSCQVNLAELHQLVLITSSAGIKFLMSGGIQVPNKHSGTDPCLAKYSTEHSTERIYSPAGCTSKVMASISSVIITFSFCGFTLKVKWYMDIRAKKRGYTGEVSVEWVRLMWREYERGLEQQPGSRERGKTQSVAFRFLLSLFLLTADAAWLFPHVSPRPCGLETVGSELLLGTAREAPSHSGGWREVAPLGLCPPCCFESSCRR